MFYGTLIFQQSSKICIGRYVGGHTLAKTTFCLYLVKRLIVTFRCAINVTTSSFNIFLEVQVQNLCSESGNS